MKTKVAASVLMSFIVMACSFIPLSAADYAARVVSVFKTQGNDVKMTKGTPKEFAAKEKMKLLDGYTIATGKSSYVWLQLDEETVVKADEMSKVSVSKASSNKLSLTVLSGAISVDAAPQKEGDTLEVRAGNTALAVRGTSFVFKSIAGGAYIVMFSGSGDVNGVILEAGRTMTVYNNDTDETTTYELRSILDEEVTDLFLLETILEHGEQLVEDGILTQEELEKIADLIAEIKRALAPPQTTSRGGGGSRRATTIATYNGAGYTTLQQALDAAGDVAEYDNGQNVDLTSNYTIPDNEEVTIPEHVTLTIDAGVTLTNDGTLEVDETEKFTNDGTFINNGDFTNYGNFTNNGTVRQVLGSFTSQNVTITNNGYFGFEGGTYKQQVRFYSVTVGTISFSDGITFDVTAALDTPSGFYDTSNVPINTVADDLKGKTFDWDSDAGGSSVAGWLAQP